MPIKIVIEKTDARSAILGERITANVPLPLVDSYISLIKKTWPQTKVSRAG